MTFRFHVFAPAQVQYISDQWYAQWPIQPQAVGTPNTPDSYFEIKSSSTAVNLDPHSQQISVTVNPQVTIGQTLTANAKLFTLTSGHVDGFGSKTALFAVEADASGGRHAQRQIAMEVYNQAEITPWQTDVPVQAYPPEIVADGYCIPGGVPMTDVTWSDHTGESRSNSMGFHVTDGEMSQLSIYFAQVNWNQSFNIDVQGSESSDHSMDVAIHRMILPGFYATFYRQPVRLQRRVNLVLHNACGARREIGQAYVNHWQWNPEIAMGMECPVPSALPVFCNDPDGKCD
jgi:hypothetical protein